MIEEEQPFPLSAGAGVFNAIGTRAMCESFVRWGYPSWWHLVTGGLEILSREPDLREVRLLIGGNEPERP
jgi:hypothetical protein